MESTLRAALDGGTQVVTAHRRQARQIRFRYAAARQAEGQDAWETPRVSGWDDWLVALHDDVMWSGYSAPRNQRKLITPFQAQVLWESILRAHGGDVLDDIPGAARKAASAWSLVQAYRLPDPGKASQQTGEVAAFATWMRRYFSRCRDHSLVDHARLADILTPALRGGAIDPPASLLLVGFDELTPQQRLLLKTLEDLGTSLDRYKGARVSGTAVRARFDTHHDEITAAACFVRRVLTDGAGGNTAVLLPNLATERKTIVRIFDDILMPGSSLPGGNAVGRPYNLALGEPLSSIALVRSALGIAGLVRGTLRFEALSEFLRSPFLRGGSSEAPLRARFDAWLRENQVSQVRVADLPALFERFGQQVPRVATKSVTAAILGALPALVDAAGASQKASRWCSRWQALLEACGWPGEMTLDSELFQSAERFRGLVDEMAGLDFLTGTLTADEAVTRLRDFCKSVKFQPQTPDLSIHLMLPDQAMGLQFDHLWWCGVHAGAFPPAAEPNPFLPRRWQHEHSIPGSSAPVELARAQRLTTRLLRGAREVIVTAPIRVDDHPVSVSPLVADLPNVGVTELNLAEATVLQSGLASAADLESLDDMTGPALDDVARNQPVPGGVSVLSLQASCPFRAFAQLRLHADTLDDVRPGLTAAERGSLLHNMLDRLWRRLQSSDILSRVDLSGDVPDDFIELQLFEMADEVLERFNSRRVVPLSARFRELERVRLINRARRWLVVEAARGPFRVHATERSATIVLNGLSINVKMDRIDELENGALAVIDYKTGSASINDWFGDRPTQPQLPLYALAQEAPVDAVAFGLVHPSKPRFDGVTREAGSLPGVRELGRVRNDDAGSLDWDGLLNYWRERLVALADQFVAGHAAVDPKDANACRYCPLPSLCRIDSAQSLAGEDAEDQEAGYE